MTNIEKRYQYLTKSGVTWTRWFILRSYDTEEDANKDFFRVSRVKEPNGLLNEYRIV